MKHVPFALCFVLFASQAQAHVKWFANFTVEAPPRPVAATLADTWFWTALALVLLFFLITRRVEEESLGRWLLRRLDRVFAPLWAMADDVMRLVIAAFLVATFAAGGVYLTPELHTHSDWVPWAQLLIAALIFSRSTQPVAGLGILMLWGLALRDYQLFHLLDYLALGLAVAGYLMLEASPLPEWRLHRWQVLRWGVAIALMWSSLEKFAYPDWFYPLIEEKPFLTFGLPRDMFIPMAGVAEFTMGFGLLWTPLVRRLSALALLVIFSSAIGLFGRVDLIGHALIMATILMVAANPEQPSHLRPLIRQRIAAVPPALATGLSVFVLGYWGTHHAIYGLDAAPAEQHAQAIMGPRADEVHVGRSGSD